MTTTAVTHGYEIPRAIKAMSIASRIQNDGTDKMNDEHYSDHISAMIGACHHSSVPGNAAILGKYVEHTRTYPSIETFKMVAAILGRFDVSDTYDHGERGSDD